MTKIIEMATEFSRDLERVSDNPYGSMRKAIDYLFEEVRETERAFVSHNIFMETKDAEADEAALEEVIDGFADVAFVALNGLYKSFIFCGHEHELAKDYLEEVMLRVCSANLAKKNSDGTVTYNDKGKIVKPSGWTAPTYGDLL